LISEERKFTVLTVLSERPPTEPGFLLAGVNFICMVQQTDGKTVTS